MRILHVVNHTGRHNGNVHAAVDLACAEADLGQDVAICSSGGDFDDVLTAHGVKIYHLASLKSAKAGPRNMLAIRKILADRDIQIVHAHMMKSALLAFGASRLNKAKVVTTVHNAFEKSAIVMIVGDRVIAVSKAVGLGMEARGIPASRLRVVLNGTIGTARYPAKRPEPEPLSHPAVLFVGGMHPRKGVAELLSGFSLARRSRADLHLYLVGEGPCEDEYAGSVAEVDKDHIHFQGALPDPRSFMLGADMLILASRADPAPLVLSEAREAGLAVVGTRVDGIPELLEDGRAGLLIEPNSPEAIAAGILAVMKDEESLALHRAMSQVDIDRMSLRRVAEETLAVYAEVARA